MRRKDKNYLEKNDMMKVEAGYKLNEFGKEKQSQAAKRMPHIMEERDGVKKDIFKFADIKKSKP